MSITIQVQLFAELAEVAKQAEFNYLTSAANVSELYGELQTQFNFRFPQRALKAARNGEFTTWDQALAQSDVIAFLPPFSGG
jgi:molybdopterin converting factor small subunit